MIVSQDGFRHSNEFNPQRNALLVLSSSACFGMAGTPEPGVDSWAPALPFGVDY